MGIQSPTYNYPQPLASSVYRLSVVNDVVVSFMYWFVVVHVAWISVWVKVWPEREGEGDLISAKRKYEDLRLAGHLLHNRGGSIGFY